MLRRWSYHSPLHEALSFRNCSTATMYSVYGQFLHGPQALLRRGCSYFMETSSGYLLRGCSYIHCGALYLIAPRCYGQHIHSGALYLFAPHVETFNKPISSNPSLFVLYFIYFVSIHEEILLPYHSPLHEALSSRNCSTAMYIH